MAFGDEANFSNVAAALVQQSRCSRSRQEHRQKVGLIRRAIERERRILATRTHIPFLDDTTEMDARSLFQDNILSMCIFSFDSHSLFLRRVSAKTNLSLTRINTALFTRRSLPWPRIVLAVARIHVSRTFEQISDLCKNSLKQDVYTSLFIKRNRKVMF